MAGDGNRVFFRGVTGNEKLVGDGNRVFFFLFLFFMCVRVEWEGRWCGRVAVEEEGDERRESCKESDRCVMCFSKGDSRWTTCCDLTVIDGSTSDLS